MVAVSYTWQLAFQHGMKGDCSQQWSALKGEGQSQETTALQLWILRPSDPWQDQFRKILTRSSMIV